MHLHTLRKDILYSEISQAEISRLWADVRAFSLSRLGASAYPSSNQPQVF